MITLLITEPLINGGDDGTRMPTFPSLLTGRSNQRFNEMFALAIFNILFPLYSTGSVSVFFMID